MKKENAQEKHYLEKYIQTMLLKNPRFPLFEISVKSRMNGNNKSLIKSTIQRAWDRNPPFNFEKDLNKTIEYNCFRGVY